MKTKKSYLNFSKYMCTEHNRYTKSMEPLAPRPASRRGSLAGTSPAGQLVWNCQKDQRHQTGRAAVVSFWFIMMIIYFFMVWYYINNIMVWYDTGILVLILVKIGLLYWLCDSKTNIKPISHQYNGWYDILSSPFKQLLLNMFLILDLWYIILHFCFILIFDIYIYI